MCVWHWINRSYRSRLQMWHIVWTNDPRNVAFRVPGNKQSNQIGELAVIIIVIQKVHHFCPLEIMCRNGNTRTNRHPDTDRLQYIRCKTSHNQLNNSIQGHPQKKMQTTKIRNGKKPVVVQRQDRHQENTPEWPDTKTKGLTRLLQILISKVSHLIWVLRCKRVI